MKRTKILRNAAKCKKCGDIIESTYRHDFKWCKCKAIFVDGGMDYLRRGGAPEDCIDLSRTEKEKNPPTFDPKNLDI